MAIWIPWENSDIINKKEEEIYCDILKIISDKIISINSQYDWIAEIIKKVWLWEKIELEEYRKVNNYLSFIKLVESPDKEFDKIGINYWFESFNDIKTKLLNKMFLSLNNNTKNKVSDIIYTEKEDWLHIEWWPVNIEDIIKNVKPWKDWKISIQSIDSLILD